jgi:hypothetical protein
MNHYKEMEEMNEKTSEPSFIGGPLASNGQTIYRIKSQCRPALDDALELLEATGAAASPV